MTESLMTALQSLVVKRLT